METGGFWTSVSSESPGRSVMSGVSKLPYRSYSSSLIERYGHKVFRVGVDAGFSCPNRCGEKGTGGCVYCDSQGARAAYLRTSESAFRHDSGFEAGIDEACNMADDVVGRVADKVVDAADLSESACLDSFPSLNSCSASNDALYADFDMDSLGCTCREGIKAQIERGRRFIETRYKVSHFALYLQSFSNTFAPVERLKVVYDYVLGDYDWEGFIVSTRPDCLDDSKLSLLSSYKGRCGDVCVELGLQSGSDRILSLMHRGHDVQCFMDACRLVKAHGLELCVHVLTGFPGEGKAELDDTIAVLNSVEPDAIKIHNLNIASGTALYDMYLNGEVTAPCMTRHIETVIYILRRIPSNVVIERLVCETPSHRLASPRAFADKNTFLRALESRMASIGAVQGDMYGRSV